MISTEDGGRRTEEREAGRERDCRPYAPEFGDGGAGPEVVLDGLGADDPAGGAVLALVHQLRRVVPVLRLDLRRAVPHVRALDAEALDEHLAFPPPLTAVLEWECCQASERMEEAAAAGLCDRRRCPGRGIYRGFDGHCHEAARD